MNIALFKKYLLNPCFRMQQPLFLGLLLQYYNINHDLPSNTLVNYNFQLYNLLVYKVYVLYNNIT